MVKHSLKVIAVIVVMGIICGNCLAKEADDPNKAGHKVKERAKAVKDHSQLKLDEMNKNLKLTKDQHEKAKAILADENKQIDAVMQDKALSKEKQDAKIKEIKKSSHESIEKILTPEQKEKQKKLHAEHQRVHDANSKK